MKLNLFTALAISLASTTTYSLAADLIVEEPAAAVVAPAGFYATFFAGGSFASGDTTMGDSDIPIGITMGVDLEGGFIVGGAIGKELYPNLRGELEFSYIQADVDTFLGTPVPDEVDITSRGYNVLANLWYDFENDTTFTPYVGAGVGYGSTELSFEGESVEASGLLYQLGAGVKMEVAENISLDLGYRYRVLSDADTTLEGIPTDEYDATTDATNHIVQLGVTFGF